jgi:hypothetical protein
MDEEPAMSNYIHTIGLSVAFALEAGAQSESAQPKPPRGITVTVVQGDGVVHELPRPPLSRLSIRVADSKGQPIRDAVTVFQFPEAGASAMFSDGSVVKVLLTNANGEAVSEVKSNEVPGTYAPTVTVT